MVLLLLLSINNGNNINIGISYYIKSIKNNNEYYSSTNYNKIRNCNWSNNILIYLLAKNNSSIYKGGGGSNSSHNANFRHYMIMIINMNVRGITCLNLIFCTGSYINLGSTKIIVELVVFVLISL